MAAGKHNIIIQKKASFLKDFYLYSTYISKDNEGNVPLDLTGATVTAKVKKKATDTATVITFATSVVDGPAGRLRLSLSAAQTAALGFDVGVYDILVTFPSGFVDKFVEGNVVLDKTVS